MEISPAVTTPSFPFEKLPIGWRSASLSTRTRFGADRREAARQMALFTEDTDFLVYMDRESPSPTRHLRGGLLSSRCSKNSTPTKPPCISTVKSSAVLDGERASGVTYCMAHHVKVDGSARRLMIAAIRYLDTFVQTQRRVVFQPAQTYGRLDRDPTTGDRITRRVNEGVRHADNHLRADDHSRRDRSGRGSARSTCRGDRAPVRASALETARALASTGADVTLAVRNLEAGSNVANGIAETLPSGGRSATGRPAGPGRSGLGGELCARMDGAVAHPHQQRRRDGPPTANPHAGRA